jgi:hypothetical protein
VAGRYAGDGKWPHYRPQAKFALDDQLALCKSPVVLGQQLAQLGILHVVQAPDIEGGM